MKNIIIILSFLINYFAFGQEIENKNLQKQYITDFSQKILSIKGISNAHVTGMSIESKCKNHNPIAVYSGTNGITDKTPIHESSLFEIGSITKSFISVVVLQMADEYHYSIDDKTILSKYFPEYPKWANITLRQLMNMTSGIPSYLTNNAKDDIYTKFTGEEYKNYISPKTIMDKIYAYPLHFSPGSRFEYSNINYTILGQFIKRVSHVDPEDEVQKRIFQKLGLKHIFFPKDKLIDVPGVKKSDIVHGYAYDLHPYPFIKYGEDVTNYSMSYCNTACAIASTPHDINIYVQSLYNPGKLLNKSQIKELTSLVSRKSGQPLTLQNGSEKIGFGLGVFGIWSDENRINYFYQGATDGFDFIYIYDPKTNLYMSITANIEGNSSNKIISPESIFKLFSNISSECEKI